MRLLIVAAFLLVATSTADAQSGQTADQMYREFAYRCDFNKISHVEMGTCLGDATRRMKIRLVAEYKQALAGAEGAAASGDMGGKTGSEIAKLEHDDLVKAQRAWQAYTQAECSKISHAVELGGGNGGDVLGMECELRHMAVRILELQR